jgi:NAD(P)-dependent dehydrogenase (short-subunit alcohol dehydrogenase family)
MRLQHKVAVVTGGASGMGLATVHRYLQEGARVVIADYNADSGAEALAALEAEGYEESISFRKTDVAVEADVQAALEHAVETFGSLDVVFNNAGVGGAIGPLTETSEEDWDYTFDVLAKGVFFGIKHGARIMIDAGHGGAIINTASIAGLSGDGGPLVYSAAKAAVVSMTQSSAVELAPHRIRVNAICPGFIATPLAEGRDPEGTRARFETAQPWPEHGKGEHIAGAAVFLASDDSAFVTGEKLIVDGGLTAAGPELSRKFPYASARNARVSGVTRGSTGEAPVLRKLT